MPIQGSAPNKSYVRSDGTRTGSAVCVQERTASLDNTAELADARENDFATALNAMLMKDGGNAATADIPMGGYKLTGLAAGTTNGDSVRYEQMNTLIPSGTKMLFFQAAAPTGWTQVTTYNDCVPRIVSGTGGGVKTDGQALSTATPSGTNAGTAVTQAQLPNCNFTVTDPGHNHDILLRDFGSGTGGVGYDFDSTPFTETTDIQNATTGITVSSGGSGQTHTHTFTGSELGLNYVNVVIAARD